MNEFLKGFKRMVKKPEMPDFSEEDFLEAEIKPLVTKLAALCSSRHLPMMVSIKYQQQDQGGNEALCTTFHMYPDRVSGNLIRAYMALMGEEEVQRQMRDGDLKDHE